MIMVTPEQDTVLRAIEDVRRILDEYIPAGRNSPRRMGTTILGSDQIGHGPDEEFLLRLRLAKICELERSLTEHAATLADLRTMLSLGKRPCDE